MSDNKELPVIRAEPVPLEVLADIIQNPPKTIILHFPDGSTIEVAVGPPQIRFGTEMGECPTAAITVDPPNKPDGSTV